VATARILGREKFGEYGVVLATAGMVIAIAGMGMALTATKHIAEFRVSNPEKAGRVIALTIIFTTLCSTAAAFILCVVAPWLASQVLNAPELSEELRVASSYVVISALSDTQIGILSGLEEFRSVAAVVFMRGILTLGLVLVGATVAGVIGALAGLTIAALFVVVYGHFAVRAECRRQRVQVHWANWRAEQPILWQYSVPALLGTSLVNPVIWIATSILVNQPRGYTEMGIFNAASQWRSAIAFLPTLISQPLLAILSNLGVMDRSLFGRILKENLVVNIMLSTIVAIGVGIYARTIMSVYGADFLDGSLVLTMLSAATVVSVAASTIGQAIASRGLMWSGFALNSLWAAVLILAALVLVPTYLARGLAGAFLISYAVHAAAVISYTRLNPSMRVAAPNPISVSLGEYK
jgi:O-antigen/teichoic acid export membrane protein